MGEATIVDFVWRGGDYSPEVQLPRVPAAPESQHCLADPGRSDYRLAVARVASKFVVLIKCLQIVDTVLNSHFSPVNC